MYVCIYTHIIYTYTQYIQIYIYIYTRSGIMNEGVTMTADGPKGYLEASVTRTKRACTLERKDWYLDMCAPIQGLMESSWALAWRELAKHTYLCMQSCTHVGMHAGVHAWMYVHACMCACMHVQLLWFGPTHREMQDYKSTENLRSSGKQF